jgi:hypothetical protein
MVRRIDAFALENPEHRKKQDLRIEQERPVFDIQDVKLEPVLPGKGIPAFDLC